MKTDVALHTEQMCFLLTFRSDKGERYARLVIESLRSFGGRLSHCPVWAFLSDPARLSHPSPQPTWLTQQSQHERLTP
jgi:hypothetical protein